MQMRSKILEPRGRCNEIVSASICFVFYFLFYIRPRHEPLSIVCNLNNGGIFGMATPVSFFHCPAVGAEREFHCFDEFHIRSPLLSMLMPKIRKTKTIILFRNVTQTLSFNVNGNREHNYRISFADYIYFLSGQRFSISKRYCGL